MGGFYPALRIAISEWARLLLISPAHAGQQIIILIPAVALIVLILCGYTRTGVLPEANLPKVLHGIT